MVETEIEKYIDGYYIGIFDVGFDYHVEYDEVVPDDMRIIGYKYNSERIKKAFPLPEWLKEEVYQYIIDNYEDLINYAKESIECERADYIIDERKG